jgi:hypothetical protein
MSKTTAHKQARRRARRGKRADRDLQRAVDHLLVTVIPLLPRLPATAPPRDLTDALLDGLTLDDLPTTQRETAAAMIAEFEHLDHLLAGRGWQFSGPDSDSDALTWHYLPSRHEPASQLVQASTTVTVVNRTAATIAGADVELVPAGCAWINGYWSTTVATLLANLDTIEAHRVGHDPNTLPFYACGHHPAHA